jgi:putative ABC transport system permease protein
MFLNYIKTTLRSLRRNYIYTCINILGMAIGISGTIVTFLLYDYEAKFDQLQGDTHRIFRINARRLVEGKEQPWGITPMVLGPDIVLSGKGIENYCRYGESQVLIKYEDIVHTERIDFADYNYFDLFRFRADAGDLRSFKQKNTAVITREFAVKYFGKENPVGKQLSVVVNDKVVFDLMIGAVLQKVPKNSSFQFKILIPYDNAYDLYQIDRSAWSMELPTVTYIKLESGTNPEKLAPLLKDFASKNNEIRQDWQVKEYYLMPFRDQKKESHILYSSITWPGLPTASLWGSLFMNLIILLISCFNFTNTSVAYARKRLKEIAVRKTFGGVKKQVIFQFMMENLVQCFFALLIAMYIANEWVSWMNIQWPIELRSSYLENPYLIIFLIFILILVSLLAGAYPAIYIAGFQPAKILKGELKFGGTNLFTRILLTWQFGFSVTAVFSGIVLYMNARYQSGLDWGYNKESVIVVPLHEEGNFEIYRNAVQAIPGINKVAGTVHNVGFGSDNVLIEIDGQPHQSQLLLTGDQYIKTMGLKILQGRDFLPQSENDMKESVVVNEKFIETFGIKNPLNQVVRMDGKSYYIIGIIKDFMPYGLFSPVNPAILRALNNSRCTMLCVQADKANLVAVHSAMQQSWKQLFPMKPFDAYYQEEAAGYALNTNNGILAQFTYMGIFALILSTIGLYSMVSLTIIKRTKEIGIRKVMGASVIQIIKLVNREFVVILGISSLIGCVMGYYFMEAFLSDIFTYYIKMGFGAFILAVGAIVITAFATSGRKIYLAAQSDPSKSLRYE